jgi:TP901 family phage tail tape measure protein
LGVGIGLAAAVRTLANFSQEMATVRAITAATEEQFISLRQTAKDLGATTRFSATQAAEGMVFLARAGFTTAEVLESVDDVLNLAVAGALDLGRAADIASNVLQGFRLEATEAARVVDVLALTANSANTNVEQLGDAMSFLAPAAAAVNVPLEQAAAAVGVLSNAGIQGSRAGAGLRTSFIRLAKPTSEAKRALALMGLSTKDVNIESEGLIPVLEKLRKGNVGLSEAAALVGARQASTLLVMIDSIEELKRLESANNAAGGTAQEVADIMDDNLNGALLKVVSAVEAVVLAFGDLGAESILKDSLESLATGLRTVAANMDTVLSIAGGLATFFAVKWVVGVLAAGGAVGKLTAAIKALTVATLLNPIFLIAAAIAATVAAFLELRAVLTDVLGRVPTFGEIISVALNLVNQVLDDILRRLGLLGDAVIALLKGDFTIAGEIAGKAFTDGFDVSIKKAAFEEFGVAAVGAGGSLAGGRGGGARSGAGAFTPGRDLPTEQEIQALEAAQARAAAAARLADQEATRAAKDRADALQTLKDRLDPITAAQAKLAIETDLLNGMDGDSVLLLQRLNEEYKDILDPLGAVQRDLAEERNLIGLSNEERRIQTELMRIEEGLRVKGISLTAMQRMEIEGELRALQLLTQQRRDDAAALAAIRGPQEQFATQTAAITRLLREQKITQEEATKARNQARVGFLESQTDVGAGFERAFIKGRLEIENFAKTSEALVTDAFSEMTDAVQEFFETGKFSADKFFESLASNLLKLGTQQLFASAFGGVGTGGGGGGIAAGIGALFGGGLSGAAQGGSFEVSSNSSLGTLSGVDNRLIAFGARDRETVTVSKPGEAPAGITNIINFNSRSEETPPDVTSQNQAAGRLVAVLNRQRANR